MVGLEVAEAMGLAVKVLVLEGVWLGVAVVLGLALRVAVGVAVSVAV
jgi:hypothetical protein